MDASLQALLEGLIDYAGLFPPASLDMPAAVRHYAAYAKSGESPWLGRFVLPVSRLEEFAQAAADLPAPEYGEPLKREWRLSALVVTHPGTNRGTTPGADPAADFAALAAFNRNASTHARRHASAVTAIVDVIEMKADRAEAVRETMEILPAAVTPYFEIPIQDDPAPLLAAIAQAGGRAKVRTGGVTQGLFPSPPALARFIAACARAGVAFKATAGLHHPVRSLRRLTYEPDSAQAVMHGFLNVFLSAAFALNGMDEDTITALLQEESPRAFTFMDGAAEWRGHRLTADQLLTARRNFAIAFGSCSFEEPKEDLMQARFL